MLDWPLNIGNRPPHGPPANIPITFELAVLLGGGSSFFGFFALAKLPQPYHPVFESEEFDARLDRCVFPLDRAARRDDAGPGARGRARRGRRWREAIEESER